MHDWRLGIRITSSPRRLSFSTVLMHPLVAPFDSAFSASQPTLLLLYLSILLLGFMNFMLGIVGALDEEIKAFREALTESRTEQSGPVVFYRGKIDGCEVAIVKSGVGKVLAAMTTQHLIDTYHPDRIIFTGIAGALNPALEVGDLVVGNCSIQHDFDARALGFARGEIPYTRICEIKSSPELVLIAQRFHAEGKSRVVAGRILSGDQFITQSEMSSHGYLTAELNGDAVEMEGASLALVCYLNKVPFLILRTISDKANDSAHTDFAAFLPRASHQSLEVVRFIIANL